MDPRVKPEGDNLGVAGKQYGMKIGQTCSGLIPREWARRLKHLLPLMVALLLGAEATAAEELPALRAVTGIGQWPVHAEPIAYRNRLWFANAVKGRNHNSADLYSYDPWTGEARYEQHLFSQDAGSPLVAGGLLYWPFEDSRWSLGWGEAMVTDGEAWRLLTIPSALAFHSHALAESRGNLIAATSAWRAGLQVSVDRGLTWHQAYDHPTPQGRVSRIVRLTGIEGALFGDLVSRDLRLILQFLPETGALGVAPGLPSNVRSAGMVAWRGRVCLLLRESGGWTVWSHNGLRAERLAAAPEPWRGPVLAAGADALWVAEGGDEEGQEARLWRSADGRDWQPYARLPDGRPSGIATLGGAVFVTGGGADGDGVLWIETPVNPAPSLAPAPGLPDAPPQPLAFDDWTAAGARLDGLLDESESYESHGRALRDLVFGLAHAAPPPDFFAERLSRRLPEESLSLIGGAVEQPAADLGRWILLWGMALAGQGPVTTALLAEPWQMPKNRAEKYFAAPPAALASVALVGQRDRATLDAIVHRLDRGDEPAWLRGDALGALNAVTGERFGVDVAAWQTWWREVGETWPE